MRHNHARVHQGSADRVTFLNIRFCAELAVETDRKPRAERLISYSADLSTELLKAGYPPRYWKEVLDDVSLGGEQQRTKQRTCHARGADAFQLHIPPFACERRWWRVPRLK